MCMATCTGVHVHLCTDMDIFSGSHTSTRAHTCSVSAVTYPQGELHVPGVAPPPPTHVLPQACGCG